MDNNIGENPGGGGEGADAPAVDNVDVDALVAAAKAEGKAEGSARPWEAWTPETNRAAAAAEFAFRGVVHELSNVPTLSTIKGLVEDHPVVMTFKDNVTEGHKGWGIMHYAAYHSAPREVIEYLATKDPLALMHPSADGLLPLHVALRSGAECQTVEGITDGWRGALLALTPKGDTPMHLAAAYATDPQVVYFLAAAEPRALKIANEEGFVPLHGAVARGRLSPPFPGADAPTENLPVVEVLIRAFRGAMQVPTVKEGALAFHVAAKYGSTAMLEFLRDKYLQAGCTVLWKEDRNGLVPLHWAALKNNREVVEWLADQYRPALKAKTKDGELPLHLAAKDNNLEVNRLLVERYPEGLRNKAKDGSYPLHRSAEENSADVIQFFVGLTPELVSVPVADGCHMLHLAAFSNRNEASVRLIYDLNPDAVRAVNTYGSYPVHCAAMTGTLASTELLAEAYPDALVVPNDEGLLPYHAAAASALDGGTKDLDVMCYLLKKKPDAIFGAAAAPGAAAAAPQRP